MKVSHNAIYRTLLRVPRYHPALMLLGQNQVSIDAIVHISIYSLMKRLIIEALCNTWSIQVLRVLGATLGSEHAHPSGSVVTIGSEASLCYIACFLCSNVLMGSVMPVYFSF